MPDEQASHALSDGLRIAYTDAGDGPAVMFLHGVGSTRSIWNPQIAALAPAFRCLAVDYRGYGESDVPPDEALQPLSSDARGISRNAYARDAIAVLDSIRVDRAHLCGCSLGGVVALECYRAFPERVASLTLVDTFAYYPDGVETLAARLAVLDELGIEEFARSRSAGVLFPGAPSERVEGVRSKMGSIPLAVYKASTRATWTGDYRAMLPRVRVPALVIWGEHDTSIAPLALSEELARLIPGAGWVTTISGAGHLPNVDNPAEFNSALARFVKNLS